MNKSRDTIVSKKSGRDQPPKENSWLSYALRNNVVAVILLMVLVVPLITGTTLFNSRGKLMAFELLSIVLLALVVSQVRWTGAIARFKQSVKAGPNLPIVLLVGVAAVSCAFSSFKSFSVTEFMRIGFCALLYFVAAYYLRNNSRLVTLVNGLLLVTAAVSLVGLAQMTTDYSNTGVVAGSFGTHDLLGSFLMLMLPIALALGLAEQVESKQQVAAQVVALLTAACLLMARTRSAWIGEAVALATLSFLAFKFTPTAAGSLLRQKHLIAGPLLILVGSLVLFVTLSQTGSMINDRAQSLNSLGSDQAFQTRLAAWNGAIKMIAEKPIFGHGVGTYPVLQNQFTHLGRNTASVLSAGANQFNVAHNFYLQTAAEIGIVGLALYLAAMVAFFVFGVRSLRKIDDPMRKTVLIGCMAAIAGQLVDAFSSPAYNFASVSMFQWLLVGIGMCAAGIGKFETAEEAVRTAPERAPLTANRGVRYAAIALTAVVAMAQVIPTTTAALADDYNNDKSGISSETALGIAVVVATAATALPQIAAADRAKNAVVLTGLPETPALGAGEHYTCQVMFNGAPVSDATYTITGDSDLVTVTNQNGEFTITRTNAPGSGSITVHASFTDANGKVHTIDRVIKLM